MRIGVATVYTPGIYGGAEFLADGLADAIRRHGHALHIVRLPFHFDPPNAVRDSIDHAEALNFSKFDGGQIDQMIALKFPAYYLSHPDTRLWMLHQHRAAYDLFDTAFGWRSGDPETADIRDRIIAADNSALSKVEHLYTIAERVSERLRSYNGIESTALYHPPANSELFSSLGQERYIFAPSRLEQLKRQDLLLRALAHTPEDVNVIFAGTGSQLDTLQRLSVKLGVEHRARFVGSVTRQEMLSLYANALAVFFGPLDEDYGYITLEAMLSSKAVITCRDSGGPLEFVVPGETGFVCDPVPEAIGEIAAQLFADPKHAEKLGRNGRDHYDAMNITWDNVVETLLQSPQLASAVAPVETVS